MPAVADRVLADLGRAEHRALGRRSKILRQLERELGLREVAERLYEIDAGFAVGISEDILCGRVKRRPIG
jgi:hypothetical protein